MKSLDELDQILAEKYGSYASYPTDTDPLLETHNDSPAAEVITHLHKTFQFIDWRMPPLPFDEEKDRAALDLYVRYNTTPKGIRLFNHRKVYLFQRTELSYFPAAPDLKPRYS